MISGIQMSCLLEEQCANENEKKELWDAVKILASAYSRFEHNRSGKEFVEELYHKNNTLSLTESLLKLAQDFCIKKTRPKDKQRL